MIISRIFSTASKAPITITSSAWSKMNDIIRSANNKYYAFLFSAEGGGCNGFNYHLIHVIFN